MFEAHVLYLLRRYLGQYVRGLSAEALQISVWKGDVVLKDLQLKSEALNALRLPLTVKAGFLGSVTLKIPWNKLGKDPVIVLLDRVFVLAEPVEDAKLFTKESMEFWLDSKRSQIEEMEMAMLDAKGGRVGDDSSPETKSWLGSLIATIVGNLKISVTNLHIRYEDTISNPVHPFCFGITLATLAAVTIDEKDVETFVTSGALDRLHKSLQLDSFSIYHDSDTQPWKIEKRWEELTAKEWSEMFEPSIKGQMHHKYLLHPVAGIMKYHRCGKREKREPQTPFQKASLVLNQVSVTVSEAQYRDGINLLEGVSRYRIRMEFSVFRPVMSVLESPISWWKYALQAVLQQQRQSRLDLTWENISRLCNLRRKYVQLYSSGLQQGKVDDPEVRQVDKELDTEVVLLWRMLAHAKVETAKLKEAAIAREKAKRSSSWWNLGWSSTGPRSSAASDSAEPAQLTKEDWKKINELLSYQPGQDFPLLSTQESPNMLQTTFEVTLKESIACLKDDDDLVILCGTFSNLKVALKLYPKSSFCDVKLAFYGLSSPEGHLIASVSREGRIHALESTFVRFPFEDENMDWKLSVTMSPCHVTIWKSSFDRFLRFMKSGQALSPTIALETAVALQTKLEEVTRIAQERLLSQFEKQKRFSVDFDLDAPKVRIPLLRDEGIGKKSQLLVDLGHFNLRTVDVNDGDETRRLFTKFFVSGRDISAFFVDGDFEWSDFPSLTRPADDEESDDMNSYSIFPILDRCGMSVMLHQARVHDFSYPSTCVAIEVPRLGLHFSPARYLRILHLLHALDDVQQSTDRSSPQQQLMSWEPSDHAGDARVLLWGGIGNIIAEWQPCWLALAGPYLYILESEDSETYQRYCSLIGKQVVDVPSDVIGGSENVIAICSRGVDLQKVIESSNAVVIQLQNVDSKASWLKYLTLASYRSSVSVSPFPSIEESTKVLDPVDPSKQLNLYVSGALKELRIFVLGKVTSGKTITEEVVIAELQASGGKVNLMQRLHDMKIAVKLHSLKIEDKLQGSVSPSCQYIARSVLSTSMMDQKEESEQPEERKLDDEFKDALPEFSGSGNLVTISETTSVYVSSWQPDDLNFSEMWANMDKVSGNSEPSDFVRVTLVLRQTESSEYIDTDTQMSMDMATLDFFCNRPTIVALIDFGVQLSEIVEAEASLQASVSLDEASDTGKRHFVKGLLGRGKSRVVFSLKMDMESARIFLNLEDGSQLAMLAQEKFQMDLKVYPGSFTIAGNLGNLRVCDMKLGPEHRWGWLCDLRNPASGSLVKLEFQSFNRDDDDFEGYDYSLDGRLSAVRIVFLYRFIQEVTAYFSALASPQSQHIITVVDAAGGIEKLIQQTDMDGAPALRLNLSMDTPIIVMPRSSNSKEFMEVDLGSLKLSNTFEWHGGARDDASAVHLDVLHADIAGVNMVVGIDGKAGKPMIQEAQGLHVIIRRPLRDLFKKVPEVQVDVQIQKLCGVMSDREYLVIIDCAATNVNEPPELPPNFRELAASESDDQESAQFKSVELEEQSQDAQAYFTKVWVIVDVKYAELELFKGERESPLARVEIHGIWLGYRSASTLEADVYLTLPKLSIVDLRPGTNAEMRMMFGSITDVEKNDRPDHVNRLTMLVMDLRLKPHAQTIVIRMQRPRLLVVVDFLLEVSEFFVPTIASGQDAARTNDPIAPENHIRLTGAVYQQHEKISILSADRQLIADAPHIQDFVYEGCGQVLDLHIEEDYSGTAALEPLIVIGYGKTLRFQNIRIKNGIRIHDCIKLASGSSYSVSAADGVVLESDDENVTTMVDEEGTVAPGSPELNDRGESNQNFHLDVQIVAPELTFYDSTKWPSSSLSRQEQLLRAKMDFNLMFAVKGEDKWVRSFVKGLSVENSSGAMVLDPLDISAEYVCAHGKSNILVTATDIFVRPSFNVLRLVLRLHADAVSKFQFDHGVLYRCTHFDRIWVNKPGNSFSPEVTFWRPRAPPGYVVLGDCATSGTAPPSQGVVAIFNSHHRVKKPLRFELVWNSYGNSSSNLNDEPCCVWYPVAPPGYAAIGCVAERGTSPPALNSVRCIRSDLLTSCDVTDCILYIPPGDRDHTEGCSIWRVGNSVGSFYVRSCVERPPAEMLLDLRQLVLRQFGNAATEKADDVVEVKVVPRIAERTGSRIDHRGTRNSLTTPQFQRLWWDKGTETRRVVSIWRPVAVSGYTIVGDSIVDGLEPPGIGLVLRDDGSGRLCKPVRFQQRVHICGRGLEDVYIWYPVTPPGYVALGCVATTTPDHPSLDMIRCVRMDLVSQGSLSRRPVWSYIGSRGGNSCCLWRVENQANTFIARTDLKRPPSRMAYFLAETGRPKVRENLTAEMKVGRLSVTVVDDLSGMATPLVNATMTGVNLAAHGRPDALNAVALTSIAASTFNTTLDAWEPLIEPFDGILKYEFYDGDSDASLKVGRRVRITAANTVNINITSASLEALLGAMVAWEKQTKSEQQALNAMRKEKTDYKLGATGKAALEEDDSEKLVIHNSLFCELYLRTYRTGFENVELLHEGESCTVPLPPPRFPDKLASGLPKRQSRQFVAVHVLEAKDLPVKDDGNCPDFLCALRLVTTKQSPEDQKLLPQSARSRCVRPDELNGTSRVSAKWNEVFIFEVPTQGTVNLEVVVTNQAARSGKGEAVGILSLPVKEGSSQTVSQPSSLWKLVRQSINQESLPVSGVQLLALRPPRKKGFNRNSDDCGNIAVQLHFFSTSSDWRRDDDPKLNAKDKDFGLLFSCGPDGPWESLRGVLPVATIPKTVGEHQMAIDVTMNQERKHATFRSLVVVLNTTDISLEVAICPFSLLHTPDEPQGVTPTSEDTTRVDEECFENQRYQPLAGWGSKWPGHLIPMDPGRWSTRDYSESSQEMLKVPLPPGWIWSSDWSVDLTGNVDREGWFYGPDFQSLKALPVSSKACKKSAFDFVRRRRWIRTRQRIPDHRKSHKREIVGVIQPGSSIQLPLASSSPQADYCAQVRPTADSCGSYLWGRVITDPSSASATPRKSLKQTRSNISKTPEFTLSQLEKREQLLLCVAADMTSSKGHSWLSMEADATILSGDLNSQVYDWKLSVNAPLRLENLLPCNAEYIIWEKINDARPVKRQHGIASAGDSVFVYAADVRRPIFLTWLPQGGWRPEKEGVLIFDPKSEELPLGFWMVHQHSNRRLRVSLEYDFGSSTLAAKIVRLVVPYWLSNDAGLPLSYRLVELESSEMSLTPRGSKNFKQPAARKPKLQSVVRVLDTIESSTGPIMLSPHAQSERLGSLPSTPRLEDMLSPRIGLSVSSADSNMFQHGFSIREFDDNKELINLKAYNSSGGYYKLSASLDLSSERTKVVRLQPHSMFINRLGKRLQIRQSDMQEQDVLYPNQTPKTLVWRSSSEPEVLKICLEGYRWSPPFNIETVGTIHVKLKSITGERTLFIRTEVRSGSRHASQLVIFRYASIHGPYRIENKSSSAFKCRQEGSTSESWQTLPPGTCETFAWENLNLPRMLEIVVDGAPSEKYNIDEAKIHHSFEAPGGLILQVKVLRDGTTHVVSVSNLITRAEDLSLVSSSASARPVETNQAENQFHTSFELAELGLSIVDHTPEELLYMSIQNFFISYSTGLGSQISRFKIKVDGLQVDNQLPLTPMPVLFSPQDTAKDAEFLFKFTVNMKENSLSDQQVYPYIGIQGPNVPNVSFLVNIHEPIIWRLHEMFNRLHFGQLTTNQSTAVALDPIISIGLLNTSEIRFKVTLAMSPTQRPRGVLGFWSTLLTSLGNTDDMPVRITPHVQENICMSQSALIAAAVASVRNDMLSQPLKLLSGVDLLGNASSALGHMSKGVAALSMDKKFIRSRQKQETKAAVEDIGDGIREGGEALAKGFFRGVTGILTKPFEGARSSGVEGFFQGVGKGVIGAAVQPVSGVLDLLSKTTEGANATRMKLAAVLTSEEQLHRRRLPRVIGGDSILRPYDEYKAQGQVLLQLAQRGTLFGPVDIFKIRGKFAASDAYEDHFNLPKARTLIITHRRVLLLQHPTGLLVQKKPDLLKNPCTILWDVTWNELMTMELGHAKDSKDSKPSRLIIYLRTSAQETSLFDTRETVRVVKCHPGTTQAAEILSSIQRTYDTFGPERSALNSESLKLKPGSKPYAGSIASSAPTTALQLLTGPEVPVSVPMLAAFGAFHQGSLSTEADSEKAASSSSSPSSPKGRFISDFKLVWSNEGEPNKEISIWRPSCPSGYASLGDVVQDSHCPPESVLVYPLHDRNFVPPLGFEQVWREQGSDSRLPLTIWRLIAPQDYVAVGCVAVPDYYEPENEVAFCVRSKLVAQAAFVDPALTRDSSIATVRPCELWRVANEARTFVVSKEKNASVAAHLVIL